MRYSRILSISGSALALAFSGAACSDDDHDDNPTAADYDQIATSMGALVSGQDHGEVTAMSDSVAFARGEGDPIFTVDAGGSFIGDRLGFSFSYKVSCKDAGGATVACGDDAAEAHITAAWDGTWDGDSLDVTSSLDADWTLRDLNASIVTLDGSSDASADIDFVTDTSARHWAVSYSADYDAVGFRASDKKPVSGAATFSIVVDRTVDGDSSESDLHADVAGSVTFDANGDAIMTLDGTHSYRLNVQTGAVARR